jgi:hypothetical protein
MALSKTAEEILLSKRFTPEAGGYLVPAFLSDQLDCPVEHAESYLLELEQAGYLVRWVPTPKLPPGAKPVEPPPEVQFQTTVAGWYASERLKRERRLRNSALLDQRRYQLSDLILALLFEPIIFNQRTKGLAKAPHVQPKILFLYLELWSEEEIRRECSSLKENRLIQGHTIRSGRKGEEYEGVEITERGKKRYREEVRQRLHLAEGECILDPPPPTLKVFFAWQSENTRARNILWEVVPAVVDEIAKRGDLLRPLELVKAKEPGEGAIRIDMAIEKKILESEYFVGDFTFVGTLNKRLRVNENVLFEFGLALGRDRVRKDNDSVNIILLEMAGVQEGAEDPDYAIAKSTFDTANIHRISFADKKSASKALKHELEAMLQRDGWLTGDVD